MARSNCTQSHSARVPYRKLIVPQKEPSPLLNKKIEELEAKFAHMTDEELEDLGEDDGEGGDGQSLPQLQTPLASDLDVMPYTPQQVRVAAFTANAWVKVKIQPTDS